MTVDAAGLRERVAAVVPLIAARAAEAEQQRKPDDDVIEALKRTGVFRSFVPKRYGGYEIDLDLFVDIGVDVSEACPSTGWITTFYMEHNWLLGHVRRRAAGRDLRRAAVHPRAGHREPVAARRSATTTTTSCRATGSSAPASCTPTGCCCPARIVGEESPLPRMFLVPVDDVEVKDTWHVDGMAATGSRDIVARSVRVPLAPGVERRAGDVGCRATSLPAAHPDAAVPVAHRRHPRRRLRPPVGRAVPAAHDRAGDVRDDQAPGRDVGGADPARQPDRAGARWRRRRCAPSRAR